MTETLKSSIAHAQFTIERELPVPPERAYQAFADLEQKRQWFGGGEGWDISEHSMDFQVGGREVNEGVFHGATTSRFEATYTDIVENERIVITYDMWIDGKHISTSLATYEFEPAGAGSRLVLVEYGAHLDGFDDGAMREAGTRDIIEALAQYLGA